MDWWRANRDWALALAELAALGCLLDAMCWLGPGGALLLVLCGAALWGAWALACLAASVLAAVIR